MHRYTDSTDDLADAVIEYARWRTRLDPIPLDGWKTTAELAEACGPTVTPEGMGGLAALHLFKETLGPACLSVDYPRYLSFVPAAPTEAAVLFDLVVGASSIYGGSWIEGSGAVYAENEALRWLSDLAGLPAEAGGTFVPGGTLGNLSRTRRSRRRPSSWMPTSSPCRPTTTSDSAPMPLRRRSTNTAIEFSQS